MLKKESLNTKYYQVVQLENNKPYFDYRFGINWKVENIINTDCKDGYIVQKVEIVDSTNISRNIKYYEAWKVENAKYIDHSDLFPDDTFSNSDIIKSLGKKGKVEYYSEIYWIDRGNILYEYINSWEENGVPEAGNLIKSKLYEECPYLHSYDYVYRRDKFTHTINFIDKEIIKESIKNHFRKRRTNKKEEFFSYLKNELENTPQYIDIVEQIRKEWER